MSAADHFLTHVSVVIDSREQRSYDFGPEVRTTTKGLRTGHSSIAGYEDQVTTERKERTDLLGL